ncbi:MAG: YbaK/EbsC family protein [Acutalibacteraceae bacterium]
MSIEKVKKYLGQFGADGKITEFTVSSATVELAAKALGTDKARIAKSISFFMPDESAILIVAAGDTKIDNRKFKEAFGIKPKMLSFDKVEEKTGHAVGGVCPFAVDRDLKVYLDISLKRFETVFPACGSANSCIELTICELESYAQNLQGWVDVCKICDR